MKEKDIVALFFVVAILIAACSLPVIIGRSISRRLKNRNPDSMFLKKQSSWDIWRNAVAVTVLFVGLAARQLAPDGILASFIRTPFGVIGDVLALMVIGTAIAVVLDALRRYWQRRKDSNHA